PYNGIIGRPGLKAIQAVPSTVHRMLKFSVEGGIATIRSTNLIPTECASVTTSSVTPGERTRPTNFTVALHPDFPDQEVIIGGSLSDKGRTELCSVLKKNLDIFAWQPSDITGVPRSVAGHRLNIREGYIPVQQKKMGQAPERARAIQEEVQKLVDAGIMREVYYHDWLSNPVMVKKHDGSWRMCVDFTNLNRACPQDCYPLPEIDWKVESLCGYPFKCFLNAYKGYHQIQLAEADEENTAFHTGQGVYCYTKMPFGLKNAGATYQRLMDKAFESQVGQNIERSLDDGKRNNSNADLLHKPGITGSEAKLFANREIGSITSLCSKEALTGGSKSRALCWESIILHTDRGRRKRPGKNTPQCYTKPLDSLKNWNNHFFWVDERVFSTVMDWRNAPKDGIPAAGTYSIEAVRALDTHHMDLFSLICAPNPTKVKVGSRPRAPHKVHLLTLTANRVIEMDDPATATDSSGVPPTIERSLLDFSLEAGASDQGTAASEVSPSGDVPAAAAPEPSQVGVAAADPPVATERRKRGRDGTDANTPPSHCEGIMLILDPQGALMGERASLPYSWAWYPPFPCLKMHLQASVTRIHYVLLILRPALRPMWPSPPQVLLSRETRSPRMLLPLLRSGRREYNVNLAQKVAMGSQLHLRFEQEAKLLKKSMAQAAEDKSVGLIKELEDMRARFSDLQVSHEHLSQQVASLKEQVIEEKKLKAAFEEFKRYEDDRVERRCAELDAHLDALSIDFDEELYPHMLTTIAGRRWVIGHGLRLAAMKCDESLDMRQAFADVVSVVIAKGMSEGLRHGVEHGQAQRNVESIEAYDPEAEAKFVAALQALKDLKYPLLDQLEGLKDVPIDVIMADLYLESDTEEDAPQCIRDLRPSSSQLTIPVYPKVRDPRKPWACKKEIVLADAIAANISRAKKKKKCRIVCHTHGVGSAHHARSDGVLVSAPTVVPQGLALLLVDAATQTE
nr:reverse transcriptase domain-containing protein [Tanacetum cinerariifolium]